MIIEMQRADTAARLDFAGWSRGFMGQAVDERGHSSLNFVQQHCGVCEVLRYDTVQLELVSDAGLLSTQSVKSSLSVSDRLIIDATTLGFPELLLLCAAIKAAGSSSFDILYIEPRSYRLDHRSSVLHKRDFELSESVVGYRGVPGTAMHFRDDVSHRGVFFVGFEDERLDRAFEDFPSIDARRTQIAFGVPAYRAGWEMDALANNIGVICKRGIRGGVHFCAADNPFAAYELLTAVKQSLSPHERIFVAPIGTKPHGIGAALFSCENPEVGILYDHPRRSEGRSKSVGEWHLFHCRIN